MFVAGGIMSFTNDEIALIEGVISTIYPRLTGEKLRKSFAILHRHLQEGVVNQIDLQRIDSALTFADPGQCVSFHKEPYRDFTTLRIKAQAMLRAANA